MTEAKFQLPTHCEHCGVYLQGGATVHLETCPWYPISYYALMKDAAPAGGKE